ncbi:YwgA family protein [Bacillus timonensis]|uniref:YwgA family protein n=1 Tax=Bacillus timonensis TaxID=1033734 RepID=A0A4S3PIM1_9BACI|nr:MULTISPECIES: YwgA family protein [Bacillaceae]MDR4890273.1 YwgA family protein [Fredinandcohnia sp. QZ13]THE09237.1 YwgA family protein [Bacillus timonensis]
MLTEHAKVMKAFAAAGEITGRKKLQKMIYIAKKIDYPFYEKYNFHFYGPYSEELTLRVEELCNLGFLDEVKEKKGGYYQYRYSLTEKGEQFLGHYQLDMPPLDDCMQTLNSQSARFLELVSTVLYFEGLDKEEVKEKVFTLKAKQRYTEEEIDEAYQYIDSLRDLVKH